MPALIQSAINVSEGRRPEVIEAVAEAVRTTRSATLADYSADEDHNRMVVSILGGPAAIREAALAVARVAVSKIDLRHHTGAHPRIGAVDVIPLTPLRDITLHECADLSHSLGRAIAAELGLPVYYYEASALPNRLAALPDIRKAGFEGLFHREITGPRAPDAGPGHPHPTAGAVIVGARRPLVAYNIDLDAPDVVAARRIAGAIRSQRSRLPFLEGVRALGLWLPRRGRSQVSMNVTLPAVTPLPPIFDFVRRMAEESDVSVWGSEIVGLLPGSSLGGEPPERIRWHDYRPTRVLDYWLAAL